MKSSTTPPVTDPAHSAIHMEFIENAAALRSTSEADADRGRAEVAAYHEALFRHRHGAAMDRCAQQRQIQEDRLGYLETRLAAANQQLVDRERWVPVAHARGLDLEPNAPWNPWDATMFIASLLGIVGLLAFGVFNISFNLLESGLVTFLEHPVRAYFWAALLPVGALAVKVGWDLLESPRKRRLYLWSCLLGGLTGVLAWVAAYAAVYPSLSVTPGESIAALSVFDRPAATGSTGLLAGGATWIDMILVSAQAVAEIGLSAVLGMYMTQLYTRHRRVRMVENPSFAQLDTERRRLEKEVADVRMALADALGTESQLRHQLAAFVAFATSLFHKEVTARGDRMRHKHQMLEHLSRQIQTQLQKAERPEEDDATTPSLPFPHPSSS